MLHVTDVWTSAATAALNLFFRSCYCCLTLVLRSWFSRTHEAKLGRDEQKMSNVKKKIKNTVLLYILLCYCCYFYLSIEFL